MLASGAHRGSGWHCRCFWTDDRCYSTSKFDVRQWAVLQVSERNKSSPSRLSFPGILGGHFEEFVDEPILTLDVMPALPPHLALPNYVHRLIALNRSSRSLEFAEPLLGHSQLAALPSRHTKAASLTTNHAS